MMAFVDNNSYSHVLFQEIKVNVLNDQLPAIGFHCCQPWPTNE